MAMTELEKLDAGLPYDFMDPEVDGRKLHAFSCAQKLNAIPMQNAAEREAAVRELFGSCGKHPTVLPDSFVRLPNLLPFVNTFFQSFFGFLSKNLLHGLSLDSIFHNIPCAARVSAVFS